MRIRRRAFVVLPFALALAACSGGSTTEGPTTPRAWVSEFDDVLERPDATAFERDVLSDYEISDEEYVKAQELFLACMRSHGLKTEFVDKKYVTETGSSDGVAEPVSTTSLRCGQGTIDDIESLYYGIRENPRNLTLAQAIRECFDTHAVDDGADLADAELEALVGAGEFVASGPRAEACVADPFGKS